MPSSIGLSWDGVVLFFAHAVISKSLWHLVELGVHLHATVGRYQIGAHYGAFWNRGGALDAKSSLSHWRVAPRGVLETEDIMVNPYHRLSQSRTPLTLCKYLLTRKSKPFW